MNMNGIQILQNFLYLFYLRKAIAPRWETVKLASWAWNCLADFFEWCPYISWKFHKNSFTVLPLLNNTDPGNRKKRFCIPGLNCNIPKMFQILPRLMSKLCWKFHENPFNRLPLMLLTDTGFLEYIEKRKLVSKGLNINFKACSLYHARPILKSYEMRSSVCPQCCWQTGKHTHKETHKQTYVQRWMHNLRRSAEVIKSS